MGVIREYLLSVTGASALCGIVSAVTGKNTYSGIIRLICGAFLLFTVTAPLVRAEFTALPIPGEELVKEAENAVLKGVDYAAQARARIIKEELEAYIMDKASGLDAQINPQITLTDDTPPIPAKVTIIGTWTPAAKSQLERILTQDLGIAKEQQIWMESNSG